MEINKAVDLLDNLIGIFGVFTMCIMIQAGQADDREESWFDEDR